MLRSRISRAFTLIEVVVTSILIAIVSAMAVMSYQWAINNAADSSATQALQAAALASATFYNQHTAWPTLTQLPNTESAYSYVSSTTASTGPEDISVGYDSTSGNLDLAALDPTTNTCFFYAFPYPGSTATPLRVSMTTVPCEAITILSNSLSSSSGPSW